MRAQKILLAGSAAVGKTSLSKRLKFNTFDSNYKSTIGVQLHELKVELANEVVPLILWDTDGYFGETLFDTVYAKGSAGVIVVCDVTRPETARHMLNIGRQFSERFPGRPCMCIINKIDIQEPSLLMLEELHSCSDHTAQCSAKSGTGVQSAIEDFAEQLVHRG